jgi:hypothetical protein
MDNELNNLDRSEEGNQQSRPYNKAFNPNSKKFYVKLIPSLNRAVVLPAYCAGEQIWFGVVYNKKSSALQFQLDSSNPLIKRRNIKVKMYRNLEKCGFCNVFFNLKTETTPDRDYRSRFVNINPEYSKDLILYSKEVYDLNNNNSSRRRSNFSNYLTISSWKLHASDNDLLFQLVQRGCYNDVAKMNIIRTAGLLLATNRGIKTLERFEDHANNRLRKVDYNKDEQPDFTDTDSKDDDLGDGENDTDDEYEYYDDDDDYEEEDIDDTDEK